MRERVGGYATSKLSAVRAEIVYVVSETPLQTFKLWRKVSCLLGVYCGLV